MFLKLEELKNIELSHESWFCLINFCIAIHGITFGEFMELSIGRKSDHSLKDDSEMIEYFKNKYIYMQKNNVQSMVLMIAYSIRAFKEEK